MPFCANLILNPIVPSNAYAFGPRYNLTWNVQTQIRQLFPVEKLSKKFYCFPYLTQTQHTQWGDTSNQTPTMMAVRFQNINPCSQTYITNDSDQLRNIGSWNSVLPYRTDTGTASTDFYWQESAINIPPIMVDKPENIDSVNLYFYSGRNLTQINPTNNGTVNGATRYIVFLNFVEIEENEDFGEIAGTLSLFKPVIF